MPAFKCHWCDACFNTTEELKHHELFHEDLNIFGDDFMPLRWTEEEEVVPPKKICLAQVSHRAVFKCELCNGEFNELEKFEDHKQLHNVLNELNDEDFTPIRIRSPSPVPGPSHAGNTSYSDPFIEQLHRDLSELNGEIPVPSPSPLPPVQNDSPVPGPSHVGNNQGGSHSIDLDDSLDLNGQIGFGSQENPLPYEIKKVNERTFKNSVIDRHYKVKIYPDIALQNEKLSNLHNQLIDLFKKILNEATEGLQESDLIRVIAHSSDLQNPVYVPLQRIDQMTAEKFLEFIENILNSHENLKMDEEFSVDVGTMQIPKGGAHVKITDLSGPNNSLKRKYSILEIKNQDLTCLARAILLGFLKTKTMATKDWQELTAPDSALPIEELVLKYKACPEWYFRDLKKEKNAHRQTELTLKFCHEVHVSTFRDLNLNDIPLFEAYLGVQVLVVSARLGNKFIRVPSANNDLPRLYLYLVEHDDLPHFHAIVNICGFFSCAKFCENCLIPYKDQHSCEISCFTCNSKNCKVMADQVSCRKCHVTCRSLECFQRHLEVKPRKNKRLSSICDMYWKCTRCKKIIKTEKRSKDLHRCDQYECKSCDQFVDLDHLCHIRATESKESPGKFIFFDIETTQNEVWTCADGYEPVKNPKCKTCQNDQALCKKCSKCKHCFQSLCGKYQHKANLVIAQKVCPACIDDPLLHNSKCEECGMRCKKCNTYNKVDKVFDIPPCKTTCGFREVIFKGDNCITEFGQWLFSETHKHFTVLAHNMRSFDGYFLLEYLINQSIRPDTIVYSGSKIMYMHVSRGLNIRILDSLNFFPMPLAKLPSAFELEELQKGYFPHYFNKQENFHYVGPYPDSKYYGCDTMSSDDREKFLKWYNTKVQEGAIFNFDQEIVSYCRSDVDILRRACLKFRKILLDVTGEKEVYVNENGEPEINRINGIDAFNEITLASVCSKVYRTKFLEETWHVKVRREGELSDWLNAKKLDGKFSVLIDGEYVNARELQNRDILIEEKKFVKSPIAQIPSDGYTRDQFSKSSIKWLEWCAERSRKLGKPIFIRHALNEGEYRLPNTKYRLDGYCSSTNTAYEYLGCQFHGCPRCFPKNRQVTKLPRTKQSLEELYSLTLKKEEYIKSLGMNYISIWEHDYLDILRTNKEAKEFTEKLDIQDRLNPRDSFMGGRVNTLRLQCRISDGQKISFCDYCSLYPYVCKYAKFPVSSPVVMTTGLENFDLNKIFGIIKCRILPARNLLLPLLPYKCNGKLLFPLCRTCAENQNQEKCKCSDSDRSLLGTWCSPELVKAVELGYKIIKVYEVYHWPETTQFDPATGTGGLFSSYVNLFLKIKQESSNWPTWIKTEGDMEQYIRNYYEKEGIHLDKSNICQNKALRQLAKLCLNAMWGKWGQNLNLPQTCFFHEREADKFFRCISDPQKHVKDFQIVADDTIQVTFENLDGFVGESTKTNIFIATFTTCWARLKLYEVMEMLQERVLYHDTDSVIYISNPGDPEPELGDYLGDLTSELEAEDYIVHFVGGGPKQYAYVTHKGHQVCKIRGFSLNYTNKKLLNFESMLELLERPDGTKVTLVNQNKICRDKLKRKLYNRVEEKSYKIVYSKRVIQKDSFDITLPYGY